MKEIYSALAKAQKNFEAARKTANNPHFKSKYAGLDACMDAVRDACNDQNVFVTQTIETVESGVLIETLFAHSSGEEYRGGKLYMPVAKHDAQGYGSAITYGRRYSLLTACGVAPEDDDGNAAVKTAPPKAETKDAGGVIKGTDGAMERLSVEEREYIQELAADALQAFEQSPANCWDRIDAEGLEQEQKIALWTLLPSNVRSALKRETEARKATA